jgi:hypothetical protein
MTSSLQGGYPTHLKAALYCKTPALSARAPSIELARICVRDCQHEFLLRCKYRRSGGSP